MDKHLRTIPGIFRARVDRDRTLLESETIAREEPKGGEDVHLTIDTDLQHVLERALDRRMEEMVAPRAMGILMDPYTGAILALANRPSFDPNAYNTTDPEMRKNRAVLDIFEPGSAFKIVTASAALDLGILTPETLVDCEGGSFKAPFRRRLIRDTHPMDVVPFSKAFEESSNIAMIKVSSHIGEERMDQWIRRFGFGTPTSRDFQSESRGIYSPVDKWSKLTLASLSMGQEIGVTMPQLARAFAAVANGGYLVEPHFVDRAVARTGETTYRFQMDTQQRIMSPATAATMRELCFQVVLNGTGEPAAIPEFRAGGKTGTAQMAKNAEEVAKDGPGGYSTRRYTSVFAGFAPVAQPRLVCVIVIAEPMGPSHYGGTVCGPVFKEVVREALIKMNVPEEPMPPKEGAAVQVANDADTVNARDLLELEGFEMDDLFEEVTRLELVAKKSEVGHGAPRLPSFLGMTKREAKELIGKLQLPWDPRGAGWVVSQHPAPGTPLSDVIVCSLKFGNKTVEVENEAEQPS
jgi:cell division protein FtsI/penicillin-binding protein 2